MDVEAVGFSPKDPEERAELIGLCAKKGGVFLSTCKRDEAWVLSDLADFSLPEREVARWQGAEALVHAASVKAGLESSLFFEEEVHHQVDEAVRDSRERAEFWPDEIRRFCDKVNQLERFVRKAVGARAVPVSYSRYASEAIIEALVEREPVALVGTGLLGSRVARDLPALGGALRWILSRSPERAERLASETGADAVVVGRLPQVVAEAGGVVLATRSPSPLITGQEVRDRDRSLVVVDLCEPPLCAPEARMAESVEYVGLDEIHYRSGCGERVDEALSIIRESAERWTRSRRLIRELGNSFGLRHRS